MHSNDEECYVRLNSDSLHDLTGPVNRIGTIAELLVKRYAGQLDSESETLFGFIQESSSRLHKLVAGLKTYMRVLGRPGVRRSCDTNTLLADAKASIQPEIDENCAVVTADLLPEIYCEPSQIQYTFASLIENAIKFRREPRPEIHVSGTSKSNFWVFSVRDNGVGIDPKFLERIFGTFKQIENDQRWGSGVGLAIARQIVEQHGGRIWVESEPGAGATFYFTLPHAA